MNATVYQFYTQYKWIRHRNHTISREFRIHCILRNQSDEGSDRGRDREICGEKMENYRLNAQNLYVGQIHVS